MPGAQDLHKRATAKVSSEAKSKKIDSGMAVPVTVEPPQPKHDSFDEFYPLHVTKVEETKPNTPMFWVIGVIFVVAAAILAGWYVYTQQNTDLPSNSNQTSTSQQPTTVAPSSISATTSYKNTQYGFSLTFPASWSTVKAEKGTVCMADGCPSEALVFSLPSSMPADQPTPLVTLEVYTLEAYTAHVNSLQNSGTAVPKKIGQTTTHVFSVGSQATAQAADSLDIQKAITDMPSVLASFSAITP